MSILLRNTSAINYSWDGISVPAGQDVDVTGWDLSGVQTNAQFLSLINDPLSGISVVDTTAVSGASTANQETQGVQALQVLKLEPTVRTFNGVSGDIVFGSYGVQATFARKGDVEPQSWLKLGNKVSSDKAGFVSAGDATRMVLSGACEYATSGEVRVYVKKAGVWTSGYGAIVFNAQRTTHTASFMMPTAIIPGDEIAIKVDTGVFENLVIHMRLIE